MTDRIIPARAGFTSAGLIGQDAGTDHPRSRGVYDKDATCANAASGSSPLARGLHAHLSGNQTGLRIIPARAGFTLLAHSVGTGKTDHPRSRGVYSEETRMIRVSPGSSPLARGLPKRAPTKWGLSRIIPARAGFTFAEMAFGHRSGDHPRSRGVYSVPDDKGTNSWGSSPLARGLRQGRDLRERRQRIIPARAGFTRRTWTSPTGTWDHPRSRGVY